MSSFLRFIDVQFEYETAAEPLFLNLNFHLSPGWTGVVGPNGAGKTTLLRLAAGLLLPNSGRIQRPYRCIYCEQRTDELPAGFPTLMKEKSKTACMLQGQLSLSDYWIDCWEKLSHGERKRAQLATALWKKPECLALDEPTNHLDGDARDIVLQAMRGFKGVGLLVSHDRELLDGLCGQCLFVEDHRVRLRPGNYTQGAAVEAAEKKAMRSAYQARKNEHRRLEQEMKRREAAARQSKKRLSKRGLNVRDHDAREKRDRARITGKDAVGGRLSRQMKGRLEHSMKRLESFQIKKEATMGIWLPGDLSKRDTLLRLPANVLRLGGNRVLNYPDLVIRPTDRIGITGPNGSGKSTLMRLLSTSLHVSEEQLTYVPQEIDLDACRTLITEARELPGERLGRMMTIVHRLGSDPERLLASSEPSPGEARKLLLALGMLRLPLAILMDEPTNHMDLPSIECLEKALADCPCALVLVSHDERFVTTLTTIRWRIISDAAPGSFSLKVGF